MKLQRVYVDTSVIGGCFDDEFALWSRGLMEDFAQGAYRPVTSEVVAAEVAEAPQFVQEQLAQLLALGAEVLAVSASAIELAGAYQDRRVLTARFYNDGLHIALATIAEVDVLVSWNFRHIVHFDRIRLFNSVNLEYGYKPLSIYSPREVTTYGNDQDSGR